MKYIGHQLQVEVAVRSTSDSAYLTGLDVLLDGVSIMRMNTTNIWTRFVFEVSSKNLTSVTNTLTFQGISQTCTQSMQCKLELDCIHAYLIPGNSPKNPQAARRRLHYIVKPSYSPSVKPNYMPSKVPSKFPSKKPSYMPSKVPSKLPSKKPSRRPSVKPSYKPSGPTFKPTSAPSHPTLKPSLAGPVVVFKAAQTVHNVSLEEKHLKNTSLMFKSVLKSLAAKFALPPCDVTITKVSKIYSDVKKQPFLSKGKRKLLTLSNYTSANFIANYKIYFNTSLNASYLHNILSTSLQNAISSGLFASIVINFAEVFYLSNQFVNAFLGHFNVVESIISSTGCSRVVDFSGSTTSGIISSTSNCRTITFPATSNQLGMCGYSTASPSVTSYLWQVGYFNTLYPGGLGLDSCQYHDLCPGYMIQVNVSGIRQLENASFSMISTPVSNLFSISGTYKVYGSNTAAEQGVDLLYTGQVLNEFLPLPEVLSYKYLSFVASSAYALSGSTGILIQKLRGSVQCRPTSAPSPTPTFGPTILPSTIAPTTPSIMPSSRPTYEPSIIPSSPTYNPSVAPSSPTLLPSTIELNNFESIATVTYSSTPVLMHQFKFLGSLYKHISATCQQYVVDTVQNTTATICNNVEISHGKAIFQPMGPPAPFIEIKNIVELSEVNSFSVATWLTFGQSLYTGSAPLFSFGDISFPSSTLSSSSPSFPYEPLACYTTQFASITMSVMTSSSLTSCRYYAQTNNFNYFAYGPSFCRFVGVLSYLVFNKCTLIIFRFTINTALQMSSTRLCSIVRRPRIPQLVPPDYTY